MNENSSSQIRKNPMVEHLSNSDSNEGVNYLKNKNNNIISFKEDEAKDNEYQTYNRALSGWYVITDMKISYNTVKDFKGVTYKKLQTQLTLNRIEYKPSFKSEYEIARNAIEKYKQDNITGNIVMGDE
jgi:hypothetical protein